MDKQDVGLVIGLLLLFVAVGQSLTVQIQNLPGIAGAVVMSLVIGVSFYMKTTGTKPETFDFKKLITTITVAVFIAAFTGTAIDEPLLQAELGGGFGTAIALILENISKGIARRMKPT